MELVMIFDQRTVKTELKGKLFSVKFREFFSQKVIIPSNENPFPRVSTCFASF